MLKSVRMTRILVGGHQERLEDVTATLHQEGVVHLEDFQAPTGTTQLGAPSDAGEQASDLLVRVRGLQKALGSEHAEAKQIVTDDVAHLVE